MACQRAFLTRRQMLRAGAAAGAFSLGGLGNAVGSKPTLQRFAGIPRFTIPLPVPPIARPVQPNLYHLAQRQFRQVLHPILGNTRVWGYDDGTHGPLYPGPTLEVQRGTQIGVIFENELPKEHLLPVDPHLVDGGDTRVRTMTHLHGGFVPGSDDGNPYNTPFRKEYLRGQLQVVNYANHQRATSLWYHDHVDGMTRLNVYAGLAGFYLIRDASDTGKRDNPLGLPAGHHEIPIVIQDRAFTAEGQLYYPGPDWVPEFFGDTLVVNGAVFPYLEVEPRKYRFRFLNGSNARFYHLHIGKGPPFHHIGGDGGLFQTPVKTPKILLLPAERADVVVDFRGYEGQSLVLANLKLPQGVSSPATPEIPGIMQFRVGTVAAQPEPTLYASFAAAKALPATPDRERYITLEERVNSSDEPVRVLIDGLRFDAPANIQVLAGSTEDWLLINLTEDTHPIHLHLVEFMVVERRPINVDGYETALKQARKNGEPNPDPAPFYVGGPQPLQSDDIGRKDTVSANPGVVTRIRAKFDLPPGATSNQRYVFHCHILEHEDNDMMRPYDLLAPLAVAMK